MAILHTYLPQDRLRALARGETLPDRTTGCALFADVSGFTPLTEKLTQTLGQRRGIEELTRQVNTVYDALIGEIETRGGSVISFAGDAIICWFDGDNGQRAVRSALAMQTAMTAFPQLGLKVAVTSGPVRRFAVGDPALQLLDTIAGETIARLATAEHLAARGDVVMDEVTAAALAEAVAIREWRANPDTGERFAVVDSFQEDPVGFGRPTEAVGSENLAAETLRPWILPAIFESELSGHGGFLIELRPAAAIFMRFVGIDYDCDEQAGDKLDLLLRRLQAVVERYDGTLLDLIIGDKGSYIYAVFGTPTAHEDDVRRAVRAALALREAAKTIPDLAPVQIGLSRGTMRTGGYGGATRRTYGALGDEVNLAARLMTTAAAGEILVSGHAHKAVAHQFAFEPRSPLPMKGKAEPLPVFVVMGERKNRAVRLQEPRYVLPMVGRESELKLIAEKLDLAGEGASQIIGITAEAGMGKSRLVAEVIRSARKKGFVGYGGACQSDAISTPYQAWKSIWQAFFNVDPDQPLRRQMRWLEGEIEDRAPTRVDAMPLLNVVLDLNIPENEFTQNLEPKIRQSALHALLEDCLKAAAADEPLLIVIEDLHWIDALSHDLLEGLAKALANYRVCFVLAYRPPQLVRLEAPRLEALPQFTHIELHELTQTEAESAIRAKLAQLYPARDGALPEGLVETLMTRSQGNPFYLEELLNYVRDRGLDPADLSRIELPDSLHTLILSRIDQLSEQEKTTLRVASIVGRLFRARWLTGYYPELGAFPQVKDALDTLELLDITPLDTPEPELAYLFKHIVTHEVTYESLPFATRAKLHEQLAVYLENAYPESLPLEALAFHYGRSDNAEKQREYFRKAGEAAQKNFANDTALDFYTKLLPVLALSTAEGLKGAEEKAQIHLKRGEVLELMGKFDDAESDYLAALDLANEDMALKAGAQFALGKLDRQRGDYSPALDWLEQAEEARTKLEDTTGLAQVLIERGTTVWNKGEYDLANELYNKGLALAREAGDKLRMAQALNTLGIMVWSLGDYAAAQALFEESLTLRREMGDRRGIAASLNNLGLVAQGDNAAARALYEESLSLCREMGDKRGIASALGNLGNVAGRQGDNAAALALYEESLALFREIGDKYGIASSLNNLGGVALAAQGDSTAARALQEESLALSEELGNKATIAYALLGLGLVDIAENKPEAREHILASLRLRVEMGQQQTQTSSLVGMAGLALQEGNPQFAAQVLGAVESALKALDAAVGFDVKLLYAQTLAAVKEQLGAAAFQSAWEEGSAWSLEEAVKRVLEQPLL